MSWRPPQITTDIEEIRQRSAQQQDALRLQQRQQHLARMAEIQARNERDMQASCVPPVVIQPPPTQPIQMPQDDSPGLDGTLGSIGGNLLGNFIASKLQRKPAPVPSLNRLGAHEIGHSALPAYARGGRLTRREVGKPAAFGEEGTELIKGDDGQMAFVRAPMVAVVLLPCVCAPLAILTLRKRLSRLRSTPKLTAPSSRTKTSWTLLTTSKITQGSCNASACLRMSFDGIVACSWKS